MCKAYERGVDDRQTDYLRVMLTYEDETRKRWMESEQVRYSETSLIKPHKRAMYQPNGLLSMYMYVEWHVTMRLVNVNK
jgi:hypothetical protein